MRKKMNMILILLSMIAGIGQVVILNRDSTNGERLTKIFEEVERIQDENQRLSQEIASASALMVLSEQAKEHGFQKAANIVSLKPFVEIAHFPSSR